jgi:hypothetical protein
MSDAVLEAVLRRDRIIILAIVTALLACRRHGHGWHGHTGFRIIPAGIGIMASAVAPWHWFEFATVFAMWW